MQTTFALCSILSGSDKATSDIPWMRHNSHHPLSDDPLPPPYNVLLLSTVRPTSTSPPCLTKQRPRKDHILAVQRIEWLRHYHKQHPKDEAYQTAFHQYPTCPPSTFPLRHRATDLTWVPPPCSTTRKPTQIPTNSSGIK